MTTVHPPLIRFQDPAWPAYIDINEGQSLEVHIAGCIRVIALTALEHRWEPNYRIVSGRPKRTLAASVARITIDGEPTEILWRPFQMPQEACGLRIALEATAAAQEADFMRLLAFEHDARLALRPAGESWGPTAIRFPIADYVWGASLHTWGAMVPSSRVYYHRGEDFGAITERHEVRAAIDGTVRWSPLPEKSDGSNGITIEQSNSVGSRLSHLNRETILPSAAVGSAVRAGTPLARNGHTRNGREDMLYGAHLHWDLYAAGTSIGTYPFAVEAYYRDYPDRARAVAGGQIGALPGQTVGLDGLRSDARPGESIAAWQWRLSDGRIIDGPLGSIAYARPGLYSEELRVITASGWESRSFLEVAVYDPDDEANPAQLPRGWILHHPMRGIQPGTRVGFQFGLVAGADSAPVHLPSMIDFGDGTPPRAFQDLAIHGFASPGLYTVTVSTTTREGWTMTRRIAVRVEV